MENVDVKEMKNASPSVILQSSHRIGIPIWGCILKRTPFTCYVLEIIK